MDSSTPPTLTFACPQANSSSAVQKRVVTRHSQKILKLAIHASNASSSSTKVFECPHRKDDSMLTQKGLII
ncbi:hypothetical protein H5410_030660 [Solanum commersonii]|uniref:Uncharacterized protein n=1 Tax=Solanum commersonii TaxID=4109 RepID=A0A9J5YG92_SOLCO|nr:hypothetical protein H5410_030660 [Solanum commersonii]